MAKLPPQVDVLVLGDHPSAYLAALALQAAGGVSVMHARIPGEHLAERLVIINPDLFDLAPSLRSLKRKLKLVPTYGLSFLGESSSQRNGCVRKSISAYVGSMKQIHDEISAMAKRSHIVSVAPRKLEIVRVDETGLDLTLGDARVHARLLLLGGELLPEQRKMLGLTPWPPESMYRYTYVQIPIRGGIQYDAGNRPVVAMSLNLKETHHWAWLLPGEGQFQLAVEQPLPGEGSPTGQDLLAHWAGVLHEHGILTVRPDRLGLSKAVSMDVPLGGALSGEGVASRTLCIGPAGGFYSACAEDVYPNCWSALCAVEAARQALKERHVQDALHGYRLKWGATLGDYLRGPQQNLRFLLPLVYRNAAMASRLADAILTGKSVVR